MSTEGEDQIRRALETAEEVADPLDGLVERARTRGIFLEPHTEHFMRLATSGTECSPGSGRVAGSSPLAPAFVAVDPEQPMGADQIGENDHDLLLTWRGMAWEPDRRISSLWACSSTVFDAKDERRPRRRQAVTSSWDSGSSSHQACLPNKK